MRGPQTYEALKSEITGITPAYAGTTERLEFRDVGRTDHPRLCGDHLIVHPAVGISVGSPPLMRGPRSATDKSARTVGITPAYAGTTYSPILVIVGREDHPRLCGDHQLAQDTMVPGSGSPPLMRGPQFAFISFSQ